MQAKECPNCGRLMFKQPHNCSGNYNPTPPTTYPPRLKAKRLQKHEMMTVALLLLLDQKRIRYLGEGMFELTEEDNDRSKTEGFDINT